MVPNKPNLFVELLLHVKYLHHIPIVVAQVTVASMPESSVIHVDRRRHLVPSHSGGCVFPHNESSGQEER